MFSRNALFAVLGICVWVFIALPASAQYHSADTDNDYFINLSELLRIIQFFNSDGFHCESGTEDGYAPGSGDTSCAPHDSDYSPPDWYISLSELLRAIQFFNSNGYHTQCDSEDTFAPGPGPNESCGGEGEGTVEGVIEGQTEGEGTLEGEVLIEGGEEGLFEGEGALEGEGSMEGTPEGMSEGQAEGVLEGEGSMEGTPEGMSEGQAEGVLEGEGSIEGTPEGMSEGQAEGVLEGEGNIEGAAEGMSEGQAEGDLEGEGGIEGVVEGQAEGALEQYTLTYEAGPNGSISGDTPQTINHGGSGTAVTAVPELHYHFIQWSDGNTDNPRTDTNVMSDINVTASFTAGGIIYVVQAGTDDGSSWASPLGSIQDGVDLAEAKDEIWVAAGTYTSATDPVVTMKEGVALYGGFAGTETGRSARNWVTNVTAIDGENARLCVMGANNATLDGFTVTHGFFAGEFGGGGMVNDGVSPVVSHCAFTWNYANINVLYGVGGGAMYNESCSPIVTNCTFTSNALDIHSMYGYGSGGMGNNAASPTVTNCTFASNSVRGNLGGMSGGGMFNFSASPAVINCTFTVNSVFNDSVSGGGIGNVSSSPTVTNSILWGDTSSTEIYNNAPASLLNVTYSCVQGSYMGDGNIAQDPLFASAPGDLRLMAGSPCIDSGTPEGAPPTDIKDVARPQGGGFDRGAYEGVYFNLTITISPPGCDATTSPAAGSYGCLAGDNITITAYPNASMRFVDWAGAATGEDPSVTVLMDADKTVTANFAINRYTLTYAAGANGSVFGDSPQTVDYGGSGTAITVKPDPHYHFVQWSDGSISNPRTDTNVTADINVTAVFAEGGVVYVVPNGLGDGSMWSSPLGSIQNGVNAVEDNGEVWVAAGTYTATTDPVVTMKQGVALYGGFAGTELGRSERNWITNVTTIDGENARRCVIGANNATLDGFAIARGYKDSGGGGMLNDGVSPTVNHCTFASNSVVINSPSGMGGGGMYNHSSAPVVSNCVFTANSISVNLLSSGTGGGGMCNASATPIVTNCTFTSNSANNSLGTQCGGGMCNASASPSVINCTFTANSVSNIFIGGGGISNYSASPTVTNCILWGDASEIYLNSGSPSVTYSCVQGGYSGEGNTDQNPLFVSAPDNLHLQDGSPCIDTGASTDAPATDIEGVTRPQGGGVDMGAYER